MSRLVVPQQHGVHATHLSPPLPFSAAPVARLRGCGAALGEHLPRPVCIIYTAHCSLWCLPPWCKRLT
jgi:hypothetical protein